MEVQQIEMYIQVVNWDWFNWGHKGSLCPKIGHRLYSCIEEVF